MRQSFSIRLATEKDASAIAQLSAILGYPEEPRVIAERLILILALKTDLLIVAADPGGSVIGWLQAHAATILESGFRVEITGLIIAPDHRRRGVGRELVRRAEDWAASISAQAIVVRSNLQRAESHAFYAALGYTHTKTQHVYRKKLLG